MGNLKKWISVFLSFWLVLFPLATTTLAAITYSYDANGNMNSDGTNCYTYNDSNQLSQVTNCSSGKIIASYIYDYQGNRIEKKSYDPGGNLTKTTYTPTQSYETSKLASNSATQNTSYYYLNDKLVARKNPDNSKSFVLQDNLNSTNVLTDQTGNVIEKTSYYPFGAIRTGGTQSKQLFTGQINDPETGLDYYNSRYYNSHIGRFAQADSILPNVYDPQQLNRYSYVNNNPLTYNDPSGHCGWDGCVAEFIASATLTQLAMTFGVFLGVAYLVHPAQTAQAMGAVVNLYLIYITKLHPLLFI